MNTPRDFFKTATADILYSTGELITCNVLWILACLPVITIPPAFGGLYYSTYKLAKQEHVTWRTFLEGFRLYFWASWRFAGANLLIYSFLSFDFIITNQIAAEWSSILQGTYLGFLVLWTAAQIFTFPFILAQEQPRLRLAWRNSISLYFKHFGFALLLTLGLTLILVVNYWLWPLMFILTGSLLAYLSNLGMLYLLQKELR